VHQDVKVAVMQDVNDTTDVGLRVETRLAVLGRGAREPGQPLNVPIVPASNFRAASDGTAVREYSRDDGTPGWAALEELIGDLEGGPAVCFSSGMAAIAAVLELLPVGARVVAPRDSYTGLRALLEDGAAAGGRWRLRTVDMTDADELGSQRSQIVSVVVHVVTVAGLRRASVPPTVMGDDAVAVLQEEQHLGIPVISRERPAVAEDDRLARAPVLEEDLRAIGRGDRLHALASGCTQGVPQRPRRWPV
jgi:hypothetical protein